MKQIGWLFVFLVVGCSHGGDGHPDGQSDVRTDVGNELPADGGDVTLSTEPLAFKVATFNVGTSSQTLHDKDEEQGDGDGYTSTQAAYINDYLGNSLAWFPAEAALKAWLDKERPEIVAFQEMMWDPWCEDAPAPPPDIGLVCQGYTADRPWTAERLLGEDYQLAYAVGQEDLFVGVRRDFGRLDGCPETGRCTALTGQGVFGECNKSPRVTAITVTVKDGRQLVLVNAHTTAGMNEHDQMCRAKQIDQIFLDDGSGQPLANGEVNLVLGDMNTDPFLFAGADASADQLNKYIGPGKAFAYLSSASAEGPPTHVTTMRLDHVASDALTGSCVVPGESEGTQLIMTTSFFDHRPVLCAVSWSD